MYLSFQMTAPLVIMELNRSPLVSSNACNRFDCDSLVVLTVSRVGLPSDIKNGLLFTNEARTNAAPIIGGNFLVPSFSSPSFPFLSSPFPFSPALYAPCLCSCPSFSSYPPLSFSPAFLSVFNFFEHCFFIYIGNGHGVVKNGCNYGACCISKLFC